MRIIKTVKSAMVAHVQNYAFKENWKSTAGFADIHI